MNIYRSLFLVFYLSLCYSSMSPRAHALEPEKVCALHALRHERLKGIPPHLLASISKVESGRYDKSTNQIVAWPWTINAEGKGFRYQSKYEAIAAVKKMQSQGIKSIDVGCMQVNLHHHKNAFKTLEDAFDPRKNIDYAARFLAGLKETHKSWTKAVAHYHSATPKYHRPYRKKVYDTWRDERLNSTAKHPDHPPGSRWAALRDRAKIKSLLAKVSGTEASLERRRTSHRSQWGSHLQGRPLARYRERAQKNLMALRKHHQTEEAASMPAPLAPAISMASGPEPSTEIMGEDFTKQHIQATSHQPSNNRRRHITTPSIGAQTITTSKKAGSSSASLSPERRYAHVRAYAQKLLAQSSARANKLHPHQ